MDRTVVRAGYGISYVHFHRAGGANVLPINGPQVINAVIVQTPTESTFRTTQQGYPAGLTDPARFNPLLANITYMPSDYRSSDVHSWFASVQREMWDGALLDLAYVGNRANGMLLFANLQPGGAEQRRRHADAAAAAADPGVRRHHLFVQRREVALSLVPDQVRLAHRPQHDVPELADAVADEGQRRGLAREPERQFPGAAGLQQSRRRLRLLGAITSRTTARRAS